MILNMPLHLEFNKINFLKKEKNLDNPKNWTN